jgi:hypothetical protein
MTLTARTRRCLLGVFLMAVAAATAYGADRNIRSITRYYVKPGQGPEFVDLAAKVAELYKKAGVENGFTTWQSQTGRPEYVVVRYYATWAEFDQTLDPKLKPVEADLLRITTRLGASLDHVERVLEEVMTDQSFRPAANAPMPPYVRVLRVEVRPERVDDYLRFIKTEVTPAYQKSGVSMYLLTRTRYGGPASEFRSAVPVANWAEFDGKNPIEKAIGNDGYKALLQKLDPLVVQREASIYKFVPEASYIPSGN